MMNTVSYSYRFPTSAIPEALECLEANGFCVISQMIDADWVAELKQTIDDVLDPNRDLGPASNRYYLTFAEVCPALWRLLEHKPYMEYMERVHGTDELTLHRSAAILRTAGEPMGRWHTDHRHMVEEPRVPNDIMNRFPLPSGNWFYLNGSEPGRSGIAVIEKSHLPGWEGPEGFYLTKGKTSFNRIGEPEDSGYSAMDVPGCLGVDAEPGDMICFAMNTFHANMETNERRYSCGFGMRPKRFEIDAPWELPEGAIQMREAFPDHLRHYLDGYVSLDPDWRAEN
jgi:hypothetical protein